MPPPLPITAICIMASPLFREQCYLQEPQRNTQADPAPAATWPAEMLGLNRIGPT
jgi:hypothetical protein